jgi:hypothetical protein
MTTRKHKTISKDHPIDIGSLNVEQRKLVL